MSNRLSKYIQKEVSFTPEQCEAMERLHLSDLETYSRHPANLTFKPCGGILPQTNFPRYTPYYSSARYAVDECGDF